MFKQINLTTKDAVAIAGNYFQAQSTKGIALLHMVPATKESWTVFATKLQSAGFHVLAIDLRGHGKSGDLPADRLRQGSSEARDLLKAGPDGYKNFSEAEHQASINDVDAAIEYLKNKRVNELFLGGASIGANLAIQYIADHSEISGAFLLSSGLDYRGVKTEGAAQKLSANQKVFFIGDEDDMRGSGDSAAAMSQKLYDMTSAQKEIKIFRGAGHGTNMFAAHPELEDELIQWLLK